MYCVHVSYYQIYIMDGVVDRIGGAAARPDPLGVCSIYILLCIYKHNNISKRYGYRVAHKQVGFLL